MTFKRLFDIVFSFIALMIFLPVILISWLILIIDTQSNGIFLQKRVGQYGKLFLIYKLKTIHPKTGKISGIGLFFRKYKIDELPQLINVLHGEMSLVGPRPDIEGYYDQLKGEERKILELKPGITCEASIKYYNEEVVLLNQSDPLQYNDKVIFPDKVKMNLDYYNNHNLFVDIKIIVKTIFR